MSNKVTLAPQQPAPRYAGRAMWETNNGIYLGCMVEYDPDANAEFPLWSRHKRPAVSEDKPIKSDWWTNGGLVEFGGDQHLTLFGPNGSGKTRKLLLPNLLKLVDWSIVVIDPKGELCAHTALQRSRGENHKVIVVDPCGVIPETYPRLYEKHPDLFKSHGFNPLAALDPASPKFADQAKKIAAALVKTDDSRDKYWTMAAQVLIKGVIMGLKIEHGDSERANLVYMRQVLCSSPENLALYCREQIKEFGSGVRALAASLNEFTKYSPDDRELSGIRRTAQFYTEWLDSGVMETDLRKGTIDAASMKETPTTIYLVLPLEELDDKSVWLRLMVTSLLMPLLRSSEPKAGQVPVLFMLDEFAQLGQMEIIKSKYAALRSFGVKLWTVWQGVQQASDLYGQWWTTFPGQSGAVQSFATGNQGETAEYFSQFYGDRLRERKTESLTSSRTLSTGETSGTGTGEGRHEWKAWEGGNVNRNLSSGINRSESFATTSATGQQFSQERSLKPHELAALDEDETIIFDRQGKLHFAVCPQPEVLGSKALREARDLIEGQDVEAA